MKHDYENLRRGAVIQTAGKTRVTMYLDDDVIEYFRNLATSKGRGYQTEINSALRSCLSEALDSDRKVFSEIRELTERMQMLTVRMDSLSQEISSEFGKKVVSPRPGKLVRTQHVHKLSALDSPKNMSRDPSLGQSASGDYVKRSAGTGRFLDAKVEKKPAPRRQK